MMSHQKAPRLSAAVCNASMILYLAWLLLPAVQTTGRAAAGCLFDVEDAPERCGGCVPLRQIKV